MTSRASITGTSGSRFCGHRRRRRVSPFLHHPGGDVLVEDHRRRHPGGMHRVDPDLVRGIGIRRRSHQTHDAVLGRRVGEHRRAAVTAASDQPLCRTDQDDGPAAALANHRRRGRDDGVPHAVEIRLDDRAVHRLIAGLLVADRHHAGVGDHDVDIAKFVDGPPHARLELGKISHVRDDRHHPPTGGGDQAHGLSEVVLGAERVRNRVDVGADIHPDDVGALFGERYRVTAALAAGCAGDDGDGVVEFSHGRQRTRRALKGPAPCCRDRASLRQVCRGD